MRLLAEPVGPRVPGTPALGVMDAPPSIPVPEGVAIIPHRRGPNAPGFGALGWWSEGPAVSRVARTPSSARRSPARAQANGVPRKSRPSEPALSLSKGRRPRPEMRGLQPPRVCFRGRPTRSPQRPPEGQGRGIPPFESRERWGKCYTKLADDVQSLRNQTWNCAIVSPSWQQFSMMLNLES